MLKIFIHFSALFCFSTLILAHPVIWKNGIVTTFRHDANLSSLETHYSLSRQWSIGLRGQSFHQSDTTYVIGQSNWLLKRWNQSTSQGNVYIFSGLGISSETSDDSLIHLGAQADWETRTLYTYLSANYFQTDDTILMLRGRVGFAPYYGAFNDIHSWIMLQVDHMSDEGGSDIVVMPVLRAFKNNILLELGSDFSDNMLITAMIHF